jgi:hypothetical protein
MPAMLAQLAFPRRPAAASRRSPGRRQVCLLGLVAMPLLVVSFEFVGRTSISLIDLTGMPVWTVIRIEMFSGSATSWPWVFGYCISLFALFLSFFVMPARGGWSSLRTGVLNYTVCFLLAMKVTTLFDFYMEWIMSGPLHTKSLSGDVALISGLGVILLIVTWVVVRGNRGLAVPTPRSAPQTSPRRVRAQRPSPPPDPNAPPSPPPAPNNP